MWITDLIVQFDASWKRVVAFLCFVVLAIALITGLTLVMQPSAYAGNAPRIKSPDQLSKEARVGEIPKVTPKKRVMVGNKLLELVELPDGHTYWIITSPSKQCTMVHSAGCKKCK